MIVVSGGMAASFALPASAAALVTPAAAKAPAATDVLAIAAPSAVQAPLASPEFGSIGFSGVDKPKPVVRSSISSSRSATRVPLANVAPAPASAGVLAIAASLKGIYYIYGGTTLAGFDCSGFTQYVFNRVGITLPRTAEDQRQFATPVSNPQPGDLVFFGVPAYHMGIYAGNGMMWDSPQTGSAINLRSVYSANVSYGRVR
ncbi:MAG: C40 family peptidase [Phycicoccus sp.]|nr:C40 family peptidase [Phycicoccus sp.]